MKREEENDQAVLEELEEATDEASQGEGSPVAAESVAEEPEAVPRERLARLQADFDNFRKRTVREKAEWFQRANEGLILELLPVLDHFEMGLETAEQHHSDKAVVDGFSLVFEQLKQVLRKFDVEPIETEGCEFDPHRHEAITHQPSNEVPENGIIAQTRRGYLMGDRLLRAAQVVVSSGPLPGAANDESNGKEEEA